MTGPGDISIAIRIDLARHQEAAQTGELQERYARLIPRGRGVIILVASGFVNRQIAENLSISKITVKMHRRSAMQKPEIKSVAKITRAAETLDIQEWDK